VSEPFRVWSVNDEDVSPEWRYVLQQALEIADQEKDPTRHDTAAMVIVVAHTEADARELIERLRPAASSPGRPDLVVFVPTRIDAR
jgi:hypothetical protein